MQKNSKIIVPSIDEAMEAVKTLLRWAGDNPTRAGLLETPRRVVDAFSEYFVGYNQDASLELSKTFDDIKGCSEPIILKNISFESHCEHHIAPFIGNAFVAYLPHKKVCGLSKLARVVDIYAKRLQNQETLTRQIAEEIYNTLGAKGVAVSIDAIHQCMSTRGVHKSNASTLTTHFIGEYKTDKHLQRGFMYLTGAK